ncbi:MAG TPA: DUF2231 domain-containing protein [Desulfosalsimonadaceae bacterium]|nr:DUF2231 domain-containing protein [Desulfosalsimonadaceae bacterium]
MKKWQCLVCGYIHTGPEPPEKCPVCGADKSQFVEVTEDEQAGAPGGGKTPETGRKETAPAHAPPAGSPIPAFIELVNREFVKHHVHPLSVHIPNGVLPMAVIFVFLAALFQSPGLATAAFYAMVFVLVTLPLVLYSGFNEWKRKYRSSLRPIFITKIIAAFVVTAATLILVLWHVIDPDAAAKSSPLRFGYLFIHVVMLAAAGIAGFIGGKLVFKD